MGGECYSSNIWKVSINGVPCEGLGLMVMSRKVTIRVSGEGNGKTYLAKAHPEINEYYEVSVYDLWVSGTDCEGNEIPPCRWDVLRFMPYINNNNDIKMGGLTVGRDMSILTYHDRYRETKTEPGGFVLFKEPEMKNFMIHAGPIELDYVGWNAYGCIEVIGFTKMKEYIYSISGLRKNDKPMNDKEMRRFVEDKNLRLILEEATAPDIEKWKKR